MNFFKGVMNGLLISTFLAAFGYAVAMLILACFGLVRSLGG